MTAPLNRCIRPLPSLSIASRNACVWVAPTIRWLVSGERLRNRKYRSTQAVVLPLLGVPSATSSVCRKGARTKSSCFSLSMAVLLPLLHGGDEVRHQRMHRGFFGVCIFAQQVHNDLCRLCVSGRRRKRQAD